MEAAAGGFACGRSVPRLQNHLGGKVVGSLCTVRLLRVVGNVHVRLLGGMCPDLLWALMICCSISHDSGFVVGQSSGILFRRKREAETGTLDT